MRYEDIKKIVIVSICFGFFLVITQIVNIALIYKNNPRNYADNANTAGLYVFGMILSITIFIIAPVLYLRHLNKIEREKVVDISKIQKKEIPEVGYCQICGAKILDDVGDFCSKCGAKITK